VVYGRPAIAVPVSQVGATVTVGDLNAPAADGPRISAPDVDRYYAAAEAPADDPFGVAISLVQAAAGLDRLPPLDITIRSTIPIASGLGSGAATAAALIRALALKLDRPDLAADDRVNGLTYEVEKLHHGTPSGIDNTVVSYNRPVLFRRRQPRNQIDPFTVAAPVHLLIGDTGVASPTRDAVGDVRRAWQQDRPRFERLFDGCGRITDQVRSALESGAVEKVGPLLDENQRLLEQMTVSSPELERLIAAARAAGALGAKLSGGGRGGNMIAQVTPDTAQGVEDALRRAGAVRVLSTRLAPGATADR
jgi:mevalonate kinase